MDGEIQALNELTQHTSKPKPGGLSDLAFGSLAGMAGKVVEYPFDTVKVRLQTSSSHVFSGTLDCLRQTWANEGFKGFYRGLTSPLAGAMAENALAFYAYNRVQTLIRRITSLPEDQALGLPQLFACGGVSGALCAFVISPVELVKCTLQVEHVPGNAQAGIKFNGPLSVVGHLLRTGGVRALYRGISPTVARETLGVGFWFGTYEMVCRLLMRNGARSKDALGPGSIILAGGCAGIAYNATSYPIDVVKSMIQTEGVRAKGKAQMGVVATAMQVYKTGGVPAFYRGLGITLMRAFPANAAMFMTYEYLSRLLTR